MLPPPPVLTGHVSSRRGQAAAAYSLDLLAEMGDDEVDAIRAALAGPEP